MQLGFSVHVEIGELNTNVGGGYLKKLAKIRNAINKRWPYAEVTGYPMVGADSMEIVVKRITGGSRKVHSKLNG